jgi:hypothetical protein
MSRTERENLEVGEKNLEEAEKKQRVSRGLDSPSGWMRVRLAASGGALAQRTARQGDTVSDVGKKAASPPIKTPSVQVQLLTMG